MPIAEEKYPHSLSVFFASMCLSWSPRALLLLDKERPCCLGMSFPLPPLNGVTEKGGTQTRTTVAV